MTMRKIGFLLLFIELSILVCVDFSVHGDLRKMDQAVSRPAEISPFFFRGRSVELLSMHDKGDYLVFSFPSENGKSQEFAQGYSYASAIVENDHVFVFAARREKDQFKDVTLFVTSDFEKYDHQVVLTSDEGQEFCNTSVCKADSGFIMAVEVSDNRSQYYSKFATSQDLKAWSWIPGAQFVGTKDFVVDQSLKFLPTPHPVTWDVSSGSYVPIRYYSYQGYAACPTIRFFGGLYYLMQLEFLGRMTLLGFKKEADEEFKLPPVVETLVKPSEGSVFLKNKDGNIVLNYMDNKRYVTNCYRSRDLKRWEKSPRNPILFPGKNEGINNSDVDFLETENGLVLHYFTGDQKGTGEGKRAFFQGNLEQFFRWCFSEFSPPPKSFWKRRNSQMAMLILLIGANLFVMKKLLARPGM